MKELIQKIRLKKAKVAVIGQGYVGLPLALLAQNAGFFVWGIDIDKNKILKIKNQKSYIDDISDDEVATAIKSKKFKPTTSFAVLGQADIVIIAVPTPIDKYNVPNLTYVKLAAREIAKHLRKNQLIILESTTYPGTTEEVVLPLLQNKLSLNKKGLAYFVAFSPERVDPGNKKYNTKNTPKIVGGINKQSTKVASEFYKQIVDTVVPVSNSKVAEMTKLLENIFRVVNISMINEIALLADKMEIDIWEVIKAAKTKPFGFMPFYPGPGIGGHCIAVDPFYLSYKAREYGFFTEFIDLAGKINELMPHHVITKIATALNYTLQKSIKGSKILIVGVSYKKDIKDTRESASYKITELLQKKGAQLSFFDPYIKKFKIKKLVKLTPGEIKKFDAVVIITDHTNINYALITKHAKIIIDTRNAVKLRKYKNVYRL